MNIEKVSIDRLNAASYNPRVAIKSGDATYTKLSKSIEEFGYIAPVVWNKRTGNVVGGHQRLTVLKDKGYKEVEVVVVDLDINKEKALNLSLNKVKGNWDYDKLEDLLKDMSMSEDIKLTGFDDIELDSILGSFSVSDFMGDVSIAKRNIERKKNAALNKTAEDGKLVLSFSNKADLKLFLDAMCVNVPVSDNVIMWWGEFYGA